MLEVKIGLLDGRENGEHNGVGFVGIYQIKATQGAVFFGKHPFDRVYFACDTFQSFIRLLE